MSEETQSGVRNKFLVVVDETPECKSAIRFASRRAWHVGGGVILLYVIEPPEFQHWMGVEQAMREEAREGAEELLRKFRRKRPSCRNSSSATDIKRKKSWH